MHAPHDMNGGIRAFRGPPESCRGQWLQHIIQSPSGGYLTGGNGRMRNARCLQCELSAGITPYLGELTMQVCLRRRRVFFRQLG
ncbi:hypothetical protein FOPG_19763 [Fusarium oxysporum f. sp. conglutinans race 2 54008]|uniref:Uncharacterized protein n=1 Tax=Fusarium oxysporum f. sp. conglutinans race 2 54008 TaxID=1089457 RepID=X0GK09_FUSOX|nr:hypothetical protein FOPG_19763 [Fusarium oxysporum f. sp. conglutinans race 2 54008]